eukprot:TRINITY_DN7339_c0_g1_i1.p1 TRINITY_DN7339_c0_g1~~TRINITY_DN7339_c0_g1_i1.p1  ORF type:complete len:74 (+),score=7.76 TRINITY_DN7339_c0_g1_i1:189-410(+)
MYVSWFGICLVMSDTSLGFYWVGDQLIVQRIFCAKNEDHAKAGAILAGFLKLLPPFLFIIPGMCAVAIPKNFG